MQRPQSFRVELMTHWSMWVLDHGLPELPEDVAIGESVPVSYWAGPQLGAVLHVYRFVDEDDGDSLDDEMELFRRTPSGWQPFNRSGGSNWYSSDFEPVELPHRFTALGGFQYSQESDGDECYAIEGLAGRAATWLEVDDRDGVLRRPMVAPLGAFIVATTKPATVRVFDDSGTALLDEIF